MSPLTSTRVNDRHILLDSANAFAATLEAGTLVRVLVDVLSRAVQPRRIVTYLRPDGSDHCVCAGATHMEGIPPSFAQCSPHLFECADTTDEVLITTTLDGELGAWLHAREIALALPLHAGGELHGVVLLGEKRSGEPYTDDDIGLLQIIGKQAAVAFGNARHCTDLRRLNLELEQLVYRRTQELTAAIEQLRDADQAKDRFLAALSHELLNPLTCVLAWTEMAESQPNPDMTVKALEVIRQNTRRQQRIIDDLLDISRITYGKMELALERLDLWPLVEQCVDNMRFRAESEQLQFSVVVPERPLPVMADRTRLQQVFSNLLQNAMKFTDAGGAITLIGTAEAETAVVSVSDTGRGIPPESLPSIFTPFIQIEKNITNGGLGLGLALVDSLVSLHGGRVHAASPGIGKGSRFTVMLPLAQPE